MSRSIRIDYPGAWHHIANRALGRRPMCEDIADIRYFESRLGREVRAERLEVHAFTLVTTHFHLLARSPAGLISDAMKRVESAYVRWFNRRRGRDGPLFRGRFASRRIESDEYRQAVLWYIDRNPVDAGLVSRSDAYPHGSAAIYSGKARIPPWLTRSTVEGIVKGVTGREWYDANDYPQLSRDGITDGAASVVDRRIWLPDEDADPFDDLLRSAAPDVQRWLTENARLADGTSAGIVLLSPQTVRASCALRAATFAHEEMRLQVEAGLLRSVCGATFAEIAVRTGVSLDRARRRCHRHATALRDTPNYAAVAAGVVRECFDVDFPPRHRDSPTPYTLPPVSGALGTGILL